MHRLILLGGLTLQGPSGPLTGRIVQRRQLALLSLLARASPAPLTRERAVGLLWAEDPEDRGRARLSDALYVIRQELGEDAVLPVGDAVRLNPERVWSDVVAFEEVAAEGRWAEAVELYGGPFLEGFHPSDEAAFERWVEEERRRLAERYREGLEALAEEAEGAEEWTAAAAWWKRRAGEEPTNSRVTIRLMRALAFAGDVAGALKHARVHEVLMEEELGLPLPAEVRSLSDELAAEWTAGPSEPSPPARSSGPPASKEAADASAGKPGSPDGEEEPAAQVARASGGGGSEPGGGRRGPLLAAGAVALVALVGAGVWISDTGGHDEEWVREHAIPETEQLSREGLYDSAWTLARRARAVTPDDPDLERLLPEFTWLWPELRTDPPGARVLHRPYGETDAPWVPLGTTPLGPFRLPLGPTVLRLELEDHRPAHVVPDHYLREFPLFTLDPPDRLPAGMVRVPGWQETLDGEDVQVGGFFMDRYPVTNREYMRFVEEGGYRDPDYWEHPFVLEGDTLAWEEAMQRFTDRTGRTGPSTWEVGRYPDGQEDHPVGGVSWYEAAAYATFAGKSLPTVHHWRRAYGSEFFPEHMIPESNLQSEGPAPVGAHAGMGPFGTLDMAGNVREWVSNPVGEDRFILGGGWNDPEYMALESRYTQPAFDRSATNGIRLVRYLDEDPALERARAPVELAPAPDFLEELSPPSDEEFDIYRRLFAYDPAPLEPRREAADTARHWVRETISFDAPYAGDRVLVHLYLPRHASPPFQTVVYWPGASARRLPSIDQKTELHTGFIVQSGRAVAFPVLKGTLERLDQVEETHPPMESARFRALVVQQVQDVMRTVDYLETRRELDHRRLAFYGWSWGGWVSPLVLGVESRFEAAVLHVAGLSSAQPLPEVDPLNYLSRVTLPVLMLHGRLDAVFPLESHARPFFELLGTPSEDKRFHVAESGHFVPRPELIRESLDWLDRYLGPVEGH